ncbi:MAG: carbohydrate-binding protein [Lentimicrobium sp.]|nr:carbohydrate-binding protein [Lentimicrobium sp.]
MKRFNLIILLISCILINARAQGFLHTSGKKIVNENGEEVILRGIGTGNWLLNEGYMMKSEDVAGTHTGFRQKLTETIGEALTAQFYSTWLDNHFTRTDVDSLKSWGFNSVRVAMHYKWFTLPIEDEPVTGQDTWFEDGFVRIDSLLHWCSNNQMYLILDLHGAPGGQGKDANISDYDPTKPSLWESAENRRKTVALWARLAERFADEPWLGGYDLINEPNWELPGGTLLRQLYGQITNAIREVDQNHMIIIEGNWFANDYTGLTPPWDNNMIYSPHKYWNYNTQSEINWMINLRNTWNIPIWLGETGENSNSWFTDLIALLEQNNIGWSWWPVKKAGINNVLQVPESQSYNNLMNFWRSGTPFMTSDQAFDAVMEWADNHNIENCDVKYDVIDAMIRQPFSTETLPFKIHQPLQAINAVNYDLGRSSFAYRDADSANYRLNTGTFTNWNKGWVYRNDGVDIDKCLDTFAGSNGYNVGWTENNEWMQYTVQTDTAAAYTLNFRTASNYNQPGIVRLSIDGGDIISLLALPFTGGWQNWNTSSVSGVILPAGEHKIRLFFDRGGSNVNLFSFINPVPVESVPFQFISATTNASGNEIVVTLNKEITELNAVPADFQVTAGGNTIDITDVLMVSGFPRKLVFSLSTEVNFGQDVRISYSGNSVYSGANLLEIFSNKPVKNILPVRYTLPAKIEAENFYYNSGFQFEDCSDVGGGLNLGYANNGDYIDYLIKVPEAGEYEIIFRIASIYSNGRISIRASTGGPFQTYGTMNVSATGGWQTWQNQSIRVNLPAGNVTLRLFSFAGEYNINWFDISRSMGVNDNKTKGSLRVYPNPGKGIFRIEPNDLLHGEHNLMVTDMTGRPVFSKNFSGQAENDLQLDLSHLVAGLYLIQLKSRDKMLDTRLLIQ